MWCLRQICDLSIEIIQECLFDRSPATEPSNRCNDPRPQQLIATLRLASTHAAAGTPIAAPVQTRGDLIVVKKRVSFLLDPDLLEQLRSIKSRTGLSESEQIRQGIQMWLESREWPRRSSVKQQLPEE